jgi:hypothetical protein
MRVFVACLDPHIRPPVCWGASGNRLKEASFFVVSFASILKRLDSYGRGDEEAVQKG